MTLRLITSPPSFPRFTCHATALPPSPQISTPTSISLTPQSPSLTCALHCSHFQSYASPSLLQTNYYPLFLLLNFHIFCIIIIDFRCSGCTHEHNLHRPVILEDAINFFRKYGVTDFTFDSCKLVSSLILFLIH
jgi:hypothetical protein